MTDKPEIKVGQRWVTREGDIVRVLEVAEGEHPYECSVTVRGKREPYSVDLCGSFEGRNHPNGNDLISLAPSTVKLEVALYRDKHRRFFIVADGEPFNIEWVQASESVAIEFTLLPGEELP